MYAALKGSGCDAMLRMRGRVVRETPLFVTPSAHLARLSDRLRRLKESFGQLGWPNTTAKSALDQCRTSVAQEASDTNPTSGAPFSFDGCVGSDLTGGWDILLYESSARGRTTAGRQAAAIAEARGAGLPFAGIF
jgi:hypothetical protein